MDNFQYTKSQTIDENIDQRKIVNEFLRYFSFWKFFLFTITLSICITYFFLRYTTYLYVTKGKIEIIDKAQDSEMALPTSMTIFNRSMINLENEIGVLSSLSLHKKTVESKNFNVRYFSVGTIKTSENHPTEWFEDYELTFNVDLNNIKATQEFVINFSGENDMKISLYDHEGNFIKTYNFKNLDTNTETTDLPFNLLVNKTDPITSEKILKIFPVNQIAESFKSRVEFEKTGNESDQIILSLMHSNRKISIDYINSLINQFDLDGIKDRQLEYKRTMDFVDSRSVILAKELEQIESRKQSFKENNKLTDIQNDASLNFGQQLSYDNALFEANSQLDLVSLVLEFMNVDNFELIPTNVGIENENINNLILEYNNTLKERDRFLFTAGKNNPLIITIEDKLRDFKDNIVVTINNYKKSLDLKIIGIEQKELEYEDFKTNIPLNEKILRSIERELQIKESLFLLLLQKREEAAINYAVVKPSIKIIDSALSENSPIYPNKRNYYLLSLIIGFGIPTLILYVYFILDNKIHTKDHLKPILSFIPLVGEIPFIESEEDLNNINHRDSRNILTESFRMLMANINFTLFDNKSKNKVILVTSSIKGEGKTFVSVNTASILSERNKKVILIGADLRNPQIHKFLGVKKDKSGLSDYLYKQDQNWKDLIISNNNLDILLSGNIPPNPTELLGSQKFRELINELSTLYDYIVIDSAPCMLVSDTYEISKFSSSTLYVVRANHTDRKVLDHIRESKNQKKLLNISLILNAVGKSNSYGYQYGYQYGYGYQYSYNYGYGYGYTQDED